MSQLGVLIARSVEVLLAFTGLSYTLFGSEDEAPQAVFLLCWSAVAAAYLLIGGWRVRKQRLTDERQPGPPAPPWSAALLGRQFSFFFTVAASLTGVGAALDVLADKDRSDFSSLVISLGVMVMICAWLMLHLGYARFYAQWSQWRFPECPYPGIVDFLYFAVTVGVSFAASDVEVQSRTLRWHVMVHSVISFFYNAIVLATAVGVMTSR